jgi:ssDNA-binding replication factor A large subunit
MAYLPRMHKTQAELYDLISDLKTKKEYEREIKSRVKLYDGLIDGDTAALLFVDELGRNKNSVTTIDKLEAEKDFTVIGRVVSISDTKTFKRKNGTAGKVVNLEIRDDTGTCRLVLWNDDIDIIKNKEIQSGTTLKIINGYTKTGYSGGLEINLGRWGLLEVGPAEGTCMKDSEKAYPDELVGILVGKEATRAFFKDDGEFGFVTTVTIDRDGHETLVTLWDRCVKDIQQFKPGDRIVLKHVTTKHSNGKKEYHINGDGIIKKYI